MNTELSFLMELFLDDDLPKPVKAKIKDRIKEVESSFHKPTITPLHHVVSQPGAQGNYSQLPPPQHENPLVAAQSPSMQRLMQNNPDLIPKPPVPQTGAAAQALAARAALLNSGMQEKPEPGRKSPRRI